MSSREVQAELAEHAAVVERVSTQLSAVIADLARLVASTLRRGGKVLFCGNGGSAADAQHLAAEYVVRFQGDRAPLAALALTTDTSVITAGANDFGFEHVFERQVRALARSGDLLVLHSTSGQSENLVRAAQAARELGVHTAALLAGDGGTLLGSVDLALVMPTNSAARAQEMHLTIGHIVCGLATRALAGDPVPEA